MVIIELYPAFPLKKLFENSVKPLKRLPCILFLHCIPTVKTVGYNIHTVSEEKDYRMSLRLKSLKSEY
jgi:hypothetical protein